MNKDDIFDKILPENIKNAWKRRERAFDELYNDPRSQAKLAECEATQKSLFELLETTSNCAKNMLSASSKDLCKSKGDELIKIIQRMKALEKIVDSVKREHVQKYYEALKTVCPNRTFPANYEDFDDKE